MSRRFSLLVAWGCSALLVVVPLLCLYFLFDIALFADLARSNLNLAIQWQTVSTMQWYALWLVSTLYIATGLIGIYFLRRAFFNFAKGQLFTHSNSRDLRIFSIFLFVQALAKPLHFSISSVLLSINHSAGQKMLAISMGSGEVQVIMLAMILWVMSDLLVKASKLQHENQQFI